MKVKFLFFLFAFLLFLPLVAQTQNDAVPAEKVFKARVIEVLDKQSTEREDGSLSIKQKLRLKGLEDEWKGREVIFDPGNLDVLSFVEYKVGDKVLVSAVQDIDGRENFYITGYSRTAPIFWLALLFVVITALIGRSKGLRAIIVLLLTFFIILKFIIPGILAGGEPLFYSIIGSFFILILAIYLTEGFKRTSTVAIFSILISLIITGLFSVVFSSLAKLTGFASEESVYLLGLFGGEINIKGLLLAGIIIGTLGVLDDVVVSQVFLVQELKETAPEASNFKIYKQAMRVGVSHLSSMVNTLFLAYAGASLPLLILLSAHNSYSLTFTQVIDNEAVATEVVRTLTGSIGLILAVPIATFLAVRFVAARKEREYGEEGG